MNELNNIFCEGVTKIALNSGIFHLTFSNQTEYGRPSENGDFLKLSMSVNGFLHFAACVQETMNQLIAAEKANRENESADLQQDTAAEESVSPVNDTPEGGKKTAAAKKKKTTVKKEADKPLKQKRTLRKKTTEEAKE